MIPVGLDILKLMPGSHHQLYFFQVRTYVFIATDSVQEASAACSQSAIRFEYGALPQSGTEIVGDLTLIRSPAPGWLFGGSP